MSKQTTKPTEVINESLDEVTIEKPYTFRKLSTVDIFPMFKVISKLGLKQIQEDGTIKNIIKRVSGTTVNGKVDPTELGIDIFLEIAFLVIDNLPKCETEIYQLLSQTSNLTVEEIKAQDMAITVEMIVDFIKKDEFGDFFKVVSKLFK